MIEKATINNLEDIQNIVYTTINSIYPKYYPQSVVDFFLNHHNSENITSDIEKGMVFLIKSGEKHIGTGTIDGNYMNRIFVLPEYHGKGYGKKIMDFIETEISKNHNFVNIDSSLPSFNLYIKRGYKLNEYKEAVTNDQEKSILFYGTMTKDVSQQKTASFNVNGKKFKALSNSTNGEVSSETIFEYQQHGDIISAEYYGGEILKGFLVGKYINPNQIEFTYQHINKNGEIRTGECFSKIIHLPNGKLRLEEKWCWTNGDISEGNSALEEIETTN